MAHQTEGGGKPVVKQMPYSPPQGPSGQMREGPGLGGDNYGTEQGGYCKDRPSGSPGIGGTNHGNKGSQR